MPYLGRQPGVGVRNRYIYTATASQTTFSGADNNGATLAYDDAAYVDVYLNGVLLIPVTDYAATTKTSIVLTSGAAVSDLVEILAYEIASIADTVSKANGGTFDGAVTVNNNFVVDNGTIKLDGNYPVGTNNVALGDSALSGASLSGGNTVAIGYNTGSSLTTGDDSVAVGSFALEDATTAIRNTVVGYGAGRDITTGNYNVALGYAALNTATDAQNNVAVGRSALQNNITGDLNVAVGSLSLTNNTASNNTAVGYNSLNANTSGVSAVAIGYGALQSNTTGNYNVAVGYGSLESNTDTAANVGVGYNALNAATAANNVGVGFYAMRLTTTGSPNVAIGREAAENTTTGGSLVSIGYQAMHGNTTGNYNVAVGRQALYSNTDANNSVAVGYLSAYNNTTAGVTAVGAYAGQDNTSGTELTALGYFAAADNTTGASNVAVGPGSLRLNTTGSFNTIAGYQAGYNSTNGYNTFLGYGAGYHVSSGSKNTVLGMYNGNQGGLDIRTSSNNIVLADGDGNPRTHINSTGHHFISPDLSTMGNSGNKHVTANTVTGNYIQIFEHSAASSNVYGLFVNFYAGSPNDNVRTFIACQDSTTARFYVRSNGNVVNTNNSYGAISDEKLKENIVDSGSQWDDIKALRVRKYSMKEDALDAPNRLGVIAQEVEAAGMSGLVIESPDQDKDLNDLGTVTKSVNYSVLYMKAVKALQEAMERIETLEAKVQALETP